MKVILSVPDEGYSERTWWRLFQKRVVCTKFNIYVLFTLSKCFRMRNTHMYVKCINDFWSWRGCLLINTSYYHEQWWH